MSLFDARMLAANSVGKEPPSLTLVNLVIEWFDAYKTWEATDTIEKAFRSKRLTIRTYVRPDATGSKWDMVRPGSQTTTPGGVVQTREGYPYDVSGKGVMARTNPLNFAPEANKKYSIGLHDLSASLLDPAKAISGQLYHALDKELHDGDYAIFMPLPLEEDLQLFDSINQYAKKYRNDFPRFHELIAIYRARMTRIKQAYEYDIGAGFKESPRTKENPDKPDFKIKYGVGTKIKVIGALTPVPTTEGVNDEGKLRSNALSYKKILEDTKTKGKYNEITISYRQHASPNFPQAAIWDFKRKVFTCFTCEGKGAAGKIIPDKPT